MKLRTMLTVTLMAVISFLIMFIEMPLPIFPEFLKIDISDIPALVTGIVLGPLAGIAVEALKNVLHLLRTSTGGVGELANFLVGAALILPPALLYKKHQSRKGLLVGLLFGIILMAVVGGLANYYILMPFYQNFMPLEAIIGMCSKVNPAIKDMQTMILYAIIPFNILKGIVVSVITLLLYGKLTPIFKKMTQEV